MQTLTVTAKDDVIKQIKIMIDEFSQSKNLNANKLAVSISDDANEVSRKYTAQELGGILSAYGKLTDEDMEDAITDAIADRAMLSQ